MTRANDARETVTDGNHRNKAVEQRLRNPRGGGDRLQSEIIEAATRVLTVVGEDEPFSLRAVAKEAGIAPTSVYLHFADKTAVIMAVLEKLFAELATVRDDAENIAGATGGAWERLLARSFAYVRYGLDHPGHYKVLYEGRVVPRIDASRVAPFGQPMLTRTVDLVRELLDAEEAQPIADPERVALLLWIGLHGIVSLQINKGTIDWPMAEDLAEQIACAIIRPIGLPQR